MSDVTFRARQLARTAVRGGFSPTRIPPYRRWLAPVWGRFRSGPLLIAMLFCGVVSAAPIVEFQVNSLGTSQDFEISYVVSGFAFQANQALDIEFAPSLYANLTNASAGSGFSVIVFQPNSPPGVPGDYTALALHDNPSLSQAFTVDVTFLGPVMPGSQPFSIDQFDSTGAFVSTVSSGVTTNQVPQSVTPEPGTPFLVALGLVLCTLAGVGKRRHRPD